MRIGLREMRAFSKLLFSSVRDNTFFESCGVADLITTCRMISNTSPFPIHISQSHRQLNCTDYCTLLLLWQLEEETEKLLRPLLEVVVKGYSLT